MGVKGGVGTSFSSVLFPTEFNFPVGAYFLYGKKKSHLDVSLNFTTYLLQHYDYENDTENKQVKVLYVPSISYRYQKPEGGFVARIGFCPILYFNEVSTTISPWMEASFGWAF